MNVHEVERIAQALLRRSPADQTFSMKQLLESMAREVPEDVGRGVDRGERGQGYPRGRSGKRKGDAVAPRIRLYPTNSARLNRALVELSLPAFKVHQLLWQWRGAPARGNLPFFTVLGVAKLCGTDRKVVRRALQELTRKRWIERAKYDEHHKNALYKLVPIKDVPLPPDLRPVRRSFEAESAKGAAS